MRRLPPFPSLRAFEAAARQQSFALAARELHLTPSAISHQVRQLEQHFGRALFVRRARGVELSPDGQRLLAGLGPALDQVEAACAALQPAQRDSASLALHCAPSFATQWLQPRLPELLQALPKLALKLSSGAEPVALAARKDLDLWIAYGDAPVQAGVVVHALGDECIAPMAAPALWRAGAAAADPAAVLARLTLIESALSPVSWAHWAAHHGVALPARPRPSFDRAALAIAAAVDGLGVVLESTRLAERELARGQLVMLAGRRPGDACQPLWRPLHHLCHRQASADDPLIARFRAWLTAALAA